MNLTYDKNYYYVQHPKHRGNSRDERILSEQTNEIQTTLHMSLCVQGLALGPVC